MRNWEAGDIFLVQIKNDEYVPGQIVRFEDRTLHSASCAFFDQKVKTIEEGSEIILEFSKCFSAVLVTPDGLDSGVWPIVGNQDVLLPKKLWPFEKKLKRKLFRRKGNGARIYGSGVVDDFLNAYFGLKAWDSYKDPNFFNEMLLFPGNAVGMLESRSGSRT